MAEEMKRAAFQSGMWIGTWSRETARIGAFAGLLKTAVEQAAGLLDQGKSEHRAVETIKAYIQQRYTEEIEAPRRSGLFDPELLEQAVQDRDGETITDYCIAVRIEHAKRSLKEDHGLKTYMVGERVGYPDPAYFNKVFKNDGKTPKEYRDFVR